MYRVRHQIGYDTHFFGRENTEKYSVAIVDSGIIRHPDLKEQVIAFLDFSNENHKECVDFYGHGTHVAGCLAGNGRLSGGRYHGICPTANLVVLKVLNRQGIGEAKWLIEALKYILDYHKKWNIRIVNLSLGVEKEAGEAALSLILQLVHAMIRNDILVVCAAGNYGPENNTIYGIGKLKEVITVGCYDGIYERAGSANCRLFSGRGDSRSTIIKPDIVAPGTKIISCNNRPEKVLGGKFRNAYVEKSGTSMAAPIVSGVLMGILFNFPDLEVKEIRKLLLNSATDIGYEKNMQGNGFLNCSKIVSYKC